MVTVRCLGCQQSYRIFARGLCSPCYQRARGRGVHSDYPACGVRLLARRPISAWCADVPIIPPAGDLDALLPLPSDWQPLCTLYAPSPSMRRGEEHTQRRAAEWLASRGLTAA